MRALFEDLAYHAAEPNFEILEVGLPTTSRRDVWFRIVGPEGDVAPDVYAYTSREAAYAGGADWIARALAVPPATVEIELEDNPANDPDMAGLKIRLVIAISQQPEAYVAIWGYTAAPQFVIAENLRTILLAHAKPGLALEDYDEKTIRVGHLTDNEPPKVIAIRPLTWKPLPGTGTRTFTARRYTIEVYVTEAALTPDPLTGYRAVAERLAAIETILCDEQAETYQVGLPVVRVSSEDPAPTDYVASRWIAVLTLSVDFHAIWTDARYPRT